MGACFEVYLISQHYISYARLLPLYSILGENAKIYKSKIYNNWTMSGGESVTSEAPISARLDNGCIIKCDGLLDNLHRIGIYQYKETNDYIHQIWIDSDHLPFLDSGNCSLEIKELCDSLAVLIDELFGDDHIKFFAAGCETIFEYSDRYEDITSLSHNLIYSHVF